MHCRDRSRGGQPGFPEAEQQHILPLRAGSVVPDVVVSKQTDTGNWKVELNPDTTPKIRINDGYASLVKRADSSEDNSYLRNNLQEARWFIKSLQSRNETLMKVASRIVDHQKDFLEHGEEAMKPLVHIPSPLHFPESTKKNHLCSHSL